MDTQQISDLFMIFNVSGDGSMSKQEFVYCWNGWIKKVCHHRRMILKRNTNKTFHYNRNTKLQHTQFFSIIYFSLSI